MTLSPKKYFTSSTTNRGVEAKETEIANSRLEAEAECSGGEWSAGSVRLAVARAAPLLLLPRPPPPRTCGGEYVEGGGDTDGGGGAGDGGADAAAGRADDGARNGNAKIKPKQSPWPKLDAITSCKYSFDDSGPERVEVYYFERSSGEFLSGDAGPEAALERLARRAARPARRLLAELLAAPRLLLAAPTQLLLGAERAALGAARALAAGAVQTAADHALKPALALLFNALLQPPLLCLGHTLRAARDALRPLWLALGDALEPCARLLAAPRLLSVELRPCACAHAHTRPRPATV